MAFPTTPRQLHLGVDLSDAGAHPAAWRTHGSQAQRLFDAERLQHLVEVAQRGTLDLVVLDDSFSLQPSPVAPPLRGRLDAVLVAARLAPRSRGIGLVADGRHDAHRAVPRLQGDRDDRPRQRRSRGLAGQLDRRRRRTRRTSAAGPAPHEAGAVAEAEEAVEVVTALWDSWEDDAEIRDQATHRFVDRAKLHYVDHDGVHFAVKGPSITPRSPQGQPPVVVRARLAPRRSASPRGTPTSSGSARPTATRRSTAARLRAAAAAAGREPGRPARARRRVVVLGPDRASARARLDLLTELEGVEWDTGSLTHVGTARGSRRDVPRLVRGRRRPTGFDVRPASLHTDLDAARRRGRARCCGTRGLFRDRYAGRRCATRWASPARVSRYAAAIADRDDGRPASRSTSASTSRASTTPPCGPTRARAARSTSRRSSTWPAAPRRRSSTSSSSPRGCGCASTRARSTTSTWSAGPTRCPCSPRSPRSPTASGSPGRSTRRSTSRGRSPASSRRSTSSRGGRAAWNLVTSPDAFTGENFRRGGFLPYAERYERAAELVAVARALWDSWDDDAVVADAGAGQFLRPGSVRRGRPRRASTSRCAASSRPRAARRGTPCCSRRATPSDGRDFAAAHRGRRSSRCTRRSRRARRSTPTSRVASPRTAGGPRGSLRSCRRRPSCSATPRRGRRRAGARDPAAAGAGPDGDRVPRAGVGARPHRVRPGGPAARTSSRTWRAVGHHPRARAARQGPAARRGRVARARRRRTAGRSASSSSRSPRAAAFVGTAAQRGRRDRPARAGGRVATASSSCRT